MKSIEQKEVQEILNQWIEEELYLHLETTNGAYAALQSESAMPVCAYIRNGLVKYIRATMTGTGPYRVGLKMDNGWVYAEGLTDWELDHDGRLLLAGHDSEGRLAIALQLSKTPFAM